MTLMRWQRPEINPWFSLEPLGRLQDEINRLFDATLPEWSAFPRLMGAWGPALDLFEDKDNLVAKVELPGMKKEDIEVSLHEGTLTVAGERKADDQFKDAEAHRLERFYGRFQRSVALPVPVNADAVKANYTDGVLTVILPKAEEAKPKQIAVSVGA
jgi:HSP20 family protein